MRNSRPSNTIWLVALLLVIFIGLPALLYAYRSQAPAVQTIPVTQAIGEIGGGQVAAIIFENDEATLTLKNGIGQRVATGTNREPIYQAITDYNRAHPADDIQVRNDDHYPWGTPLLGVALGLVPLAFVVGLVLFAAYVLARARAPDPYAQLARIADLRDRGVLTEEEFQREKRTVLR